MRNAPSPADLLNPDQRQVVNRRSDVAGLALVLHAWTVIAGSFALCVWYPHPAIFVLAIMLIGSRQLGLLILMHDAAHGVLCRSPGLNRLLGQLFCAWPTLADTHVYRRYHLQHHARTQQSDDPDIILTGHYPISPASLRRKLLRDISGRTGINQRHQQFVQALGPADWHWRRRLRHFWQALGLQSAVQLALLGGLSLFGLGWYYLLLWVIPLITWQQLVLRIRNIAEHAVVRAPDDHFGNARTTYANWLERALVAPYWVNYHLEHHLMMWVPCYRLKQLHTYLVKNGFGDDIETADSYLDVLRRVTTDNNGNDAGSGPRQRASGTFSSGFDAASDR